ncbi:hypothetical protein HYW39_00635, partial [Candidatus Curtissbacteria bacterium]|nr:hypothetical protein [Candidatus Curtissbacteria bacterium]
TSLREQEVLRASAKEIFTTAIDLLRQKGTLHREYLVFQHQLIDHTVNSGEPPVNVIVTAGANLDKAKSVWLKVDGIDHWLKVTKKGNQEQERFEAKEVRKGHRFDPQD